MLLPHGALIAVLDGVSLELFRNGGTEASLKLAALPTPKLAAHSNDSGKRHHASSANPDHHLAAEDTFVASAAAWLNQQAIEGKFDHVVVVAAARALGELRRHYHTALNAKLVGELAKELTGRPPSEIEHELKSHMPSEPGGPPRPLFPRGGQGSHILALSHHFPRNDVDAARRNCLWNPA